MNYLQRLSPVQRFLYEQVAKRSPIKADKVLQMARFSENKHKELADALRHIADARVVINVNLRARVHGRPLIDWLMQTKRLLNLFEVSYSHQDNRPVDLRRRLIAEYRLYSGNLKMQGVISAMSNTEHPHYGQLDYIGDPVKLPSLGYFGLYRFVLKGEANARSTFTPDDSNNVESDQVFVWNNIEAVLATQITDKYWFEYINDNDVPIDEYGYIRYIEAQILGGIFLNGNGESDIEGLYYPETDEFDEEFFAKLIQLRDSYHIKLIPY